MNKNILIFVLILSIANSYAQRKKTAKNSKAISTPTKSVLATAGYMTAEMQKNIFFITVDNKKTEKDTIQIKIYSDKMVPTNAKLQAFTANGKVFPTSLLTHQFFLTPSGTLLGSTVKDIRF